jgi:hypothetical protein
MAEGRFRGVLLHRRFAQEHLPAVVEVVQRALGEPTLVSPNGDFVYYDLP